MDLWKIKKKKKLNPQQVVISVVNFYRSQGVYPVNRGLVVNLCVELGAPNPQIANKVIQNAINNKQIVETPDGLKFADMDNNQKN